MGLPSGLIWAMANIGAVEIYDFGLYFSWGNTVGHVEDSGYDFSESVYNNTPAAAIDTDLTLSEDAARTYLGTPWRLPSNDEFKELVDNCTHEWTSINGVAGYVFTSRINGNKLFFPAAGFYNGRLNNNRGARGYYWSSSYISATTAHPLYFNSSNISTETGGQRRFGFSIRAVYLPQT